eukprot:104848_1
MSHKPIFSVQNVLHLIIPLSLLPLLVNGQKIDPTSPYEKICVSGSIISTQIDGTYEFLYWNSTINASVYYNTQKNQYLYPSIDSNKHQYLISDDPNNSNTWSSICVIANSSSDYIFNP